jgi:hypothetical protein
LSRLNGLGDEQTHQEDMKPEVIVMFDRNHHPLKFLHDLIAFASNNSDEYQHPEFNIDSVQTIF